MKKYITSDFLKIIAVITMIIDHVGLGLLSKYLKVITDIDLFFKVKTMYDATRIIGRIALPIFAYQLVQGFYNTRNRKKYAINLLVFALISEIPFDLIMEDTLFYFGYQNVIWTLLFGYLSIWAMDTINEKCKSLSIVKINMLKVLVGILFVFTANIMRTDYKGYGVLLIITIYLFYTSREKICLYAPFIFILTDFTFTLLRTTRFNFLFGGPVKASFDTILSAIILECYSILAFYFIYFDNGKRKIKGKIKYLFYFIYPVHIMVIYLMSMLIKA